MPNDSLASPAFPASPTSVAPSASPAASPESRDFFDADPAATSSLLRAFRRCSHLQRLLNVSGGQGRVLTMLLRRGAMTQRELANMVERKPATLCQQLEAMEQAGLVERTPNETDRRTVDVRLTARGEEAARQTIADQNALADQLFGQLDEQDRAELARILGTLETQWRSIAGEQATAGGRATTSERTVTSNRSAAAAAPSASALSAPTAPSLADR